MLFCFCLWRLALTHLAAAQLSLPSVARCHAVCATKGASRRSAPERRAVSDGHVRSSRRIIELARGGDAAAKPRPPPRPSGGTPLTTARRAPPPPHAPTKEKFLREVLLNNAMFTKLSRETLDDLVAAFERVDLRRDHVIVRQGDPSEGDHVYVIAEGECAVTVDGKAVSEPVGTLRAKALIGELGILYGRERWGTVTTKSEHVTLYRIDGATFKRLAFLGTDKVASVAQMKKIDNVLLQISGTKSLFHGHIILPYRPERRWLWKQWEGTVLRCSIQPTLFCSCLSLAFILVARRWTGHVGFGLPPPKDSPLVARLDIVQKIWSYQMSITTFILTFYVNQAYSFWRNIHTICRRVQGRLNDFNLLLATSVKRNGDGTLTAEAKQLVTDVASYSRLFSALFWAAATDNFDVLLSDQGLQTMSDRGLMTKQQLRILRDLDLPRNQRHNAPLAWMMTRAGQGLVDGTLLDYEGATARHLQQTILALRGAYASIGDETSTRMPLAYTHFVQVLVDTFVFTAPVALYSTLGDLSLICVAILALFYTGLLNLAKIFLDPLDNENISGNSFDMDIGVLVRESNEGSTRWKNAMARLPFDCG